MGERIYEESLGDKRYRISQELHKFEQALDSYETGTIEKAKEEFREFLKELEEF